MNNREFIADVAKDAIVSGLTGKPRRTRKPPAGVLAGSDPGLKRKTGRNLSPLALINHLNRNLVKTIRGNMGSPRLNWRTGRFANNVKVLGIDSTRSDMNTIIYSYMGYPYNYFEPGRSYLATAERDPRKLISMSIREIAQTITTEKFRTKRVFS